MYFVENGQFDSLDKVTIYDAISRFFPDYFYGTSYVELSKYIFNSVNGNFAIEGLREVHRGIFPTVKVYDYEIFLNSFKQRYPEIHPDSMFGKVYTAYEYFTEIEITGNTYMELK